MTTSKASAQYRQAVDWKIFEAQSSLIGDDVDEETVKESLLWLQPRHYDEVVEERTNDGRCGYPLCMNELPEDRKATYRIEYAQKKIFSVSQSAFYCCDQHIEQSALLQRKYDVSLPHSRLHARRLEVQEAVNPAIDDLLSVLGPAKQTNDRNDNSNPPPTYVNRNHLGINGAVEVNFENGLPVVTSKPFENNSVEPSSAPYTTEDGFQIAQEADSPSEMEMQQEQEDPDIVYHKRPNTVLQETEQQLRELNLTTEGSPKKKKIFTPRERAAAAIQQQKLQQASELANESVSKSSKGPDRNGSMSNSDIAAQFATMNALKDKYHLSQQQQGVENAATQNKSQNKFIDGSLLSAKAAEKNTADPHTVRVGGAGKRPGQKSVSWGEDEVQTLSCFGENSAMQHQPQYSPGMPPSKAPGNSFVPKTKPSSLPNAPKRPSTIMLPSAIVERADPRVLPESAIVTKQEPHVSFSVGGTALSVAPVDSVDKQLVASSEVDNDPRDDWENVMEVTAEVREAAQAASMSIEGYIAAVKTNFSVSPATTLKNLSHSPFFRGENGPVHPRSTVNNSKKVSGADKESDEEDSESEGVDEEMDQEKDDDELYMESVVSGTNIEGEMYDDMEDVDEDDGEVVQESKSLFLLIWSTLDDLFGSTPEHAFDLSDHNEYAPQHIPVPSANEADKGREDEDSAAELPMAEIERRNAQSAVLKLLRTGIQTAEGALDLFVAHLQLADERAIYQAIKGRLLKLAGNTIHKIMNIANGPMASSGGATAIGSELNTVEWTILGALVIDAIVVRKSLGILRMKKTKEQSSASDSVSKRAWDSVIEGLIESTSKRSRKLRGARAISFRDGDLIVLREFFGQSNA